jgi:polyisoprenoid-binding protein YceI
MSEGTIQGTALASGVREVDGRHVPAAGTWAIDPAHSSFEFVARHLMSKVRGRFSGVSGEARIAEDPLQSSVEIEIDTATVDTKEPTRDGHLRSGEFFDAEHHPTISFRSTAVRPGDGDAWKVDGELTIRGVTRPLTLDLEFLGTGIDPWGKQRIGFSAVAAEVNREDWGLTWNAALETGGVLLARSVRLEIETELVKQ